MVTQVVLAFLLLTITLSATVAVSNPPIMGGYAVMNIQTSLNNNSFKPIYKFAQDKFAQMYPKAKLSTLVQLGRQVVAGYNYCLVFKSTLGNVKIIIYTVPWTGATSLSSMTLI